MSSLSRFGLDLQESAKRVGAFAHPFDSQRLIFGETRRIEATTLIPDINVHDRVAYLDAHIYSHGLGVARNVRQGLLNDAKGSCLELRMEPLRQVLVLEVYFDAGLGYIAVEIPL